MTEQTQPLGQGGSGADLSPETTSELQTLTDWLLENDFAPLPDDQRQPTKRPMNVWGRPDGYAVYFGAREDDRGVSGWITGADGKALIVTSYLDIWTLVRTLDRTEAGR